MRKYVKYAKLHGGDAFVPGVGGLGSTLPPTSKTVNLVMYLDSESPDVLFLDINGKKGFIPLANVQIGMFSEQPGEDVKPVTKK